MNNRTPKQIARQSAIKLGLISFVTSILVLIAIDGLQYWFYMIALGVVIEEISYFVIYHAIEEFINQRIKVLYKTISKMKGSGDPQINMDEDVIEKVNQDVMDWASEQIEEVTILRETDSFRKDFIGNLAHELKTPLFNIQGFVMSLIEGGADNPEIRDKFLRKAEKNIVSGQFEILENKAQVRVMGSGIFEHLSIALDSSLKMTKGFMVGCVGLFLLSIFLWF